MFYLGSGDQTQVAMPAWEALCPTLPSNPDPTALADPGHPHAPGPGPHVQPAHDPDRHSEDEGTPGGPRDAHGPHVQVRAGVRPERGVPGEQAAEGHRRTDRQTCVSVL